MRSWLDVYMKEFKTKSFQGLEPARIFLSTHRLGCSQEEEKTSSFGRSCVKSVERVCWWIHELILLRAEMDRVRTKRNLTRQDMATLQEISMDIHRVCRKIHSSVLDAYDDNGISLLSIKQSG